MVDDCPNMSSLLSHLRVCLAKKNKKLMYNLLAAGLTALLQHFIQGLDV